MKKKDFDCVEMKRHGAEKVAEQTKNMSRQQELEFWRQQTQALRDKTRRRPTSPGTVQAA